MINRVGGHFFLKVGQSFESTIHRRRTFNLSIDKRKKFVISVIFLSAVLFFTEYQFGKSGILVSLIFSVLTDMFLYWSIRHDLKGNFTINVFVLPFFYSLAFSLFYFLIPSRLISKILLTTLYSFGLYSLLLSQNIFTVASIRTIALLSGARIVSFVITLISYFFLANISYSLHFFIIPTIGLIALFSYALVYQSLWTYTLQRSLEPRSLWVFALTLCLSEVASTLWFWPSSPTVIALFLTGFFYTIVGLSHVWLEKRFFKGVLFEYLWVGVISFFILVLFTSWGK